MSELHDDGNGKERKTQNIQRGGRDREFHGYSRSLGAFAITSNEAGTIEIPINRTNRQRGYSSGSALVGRDAIVGGILRQLIAQTRNQTARRLDDIKRLKEDIKRLDDEVEELNHQAEEWGQILESLESQLEESEADN